MEQRGEQREGRAKNIYRALRLAILEQALAPGTKLPEDVIGEQFGASRTIVRQALEQLASDELVEIRLNRGAAVAKPTPQEAQDLFNVRQDIEQLVVRRLCGHLTKAQTARLEAYTAIEEQALRENKPEYIRFAAEFHVVLAEMSGSPLLLRYMRHLVGRSALVLGLYGRPQWSNCSKNEHRELLDGLTAGNVERVSAMMRAHLDAVLRRALDTANGNGQWSVRDVLASYARATENDCP